MLTNKYVYEHAFFFCSRKIPLLVQVGEFSNPNGEILQQGQTFRLDLDSSLGDNTRVMLPHPEIIEASEVGHVLLVDDGKVKLVVSGTFDAKYHDNWRYIAYSKQI